MPKNISARVDKIIATIDAKKLTDVAFPVFVKNTPVDSGNARRRTSKQSNEINAAYPYAVRLDNGWSRQSPNGMTKPAIDAIRAYIKQQLGK